jgi:hypothetical protein
MSNPADRFRALVEAATPVTDLDVSLHRDPDARLIVALVKIAPALVEWMSFHQNHNPVPECRALYEAITRAVGEEK